MYYILQIKICKKKIYIHKKLLFLLCNIFIFALLFVTLNFKKMENSTEANSEIVSVGSLLGGANHQPAQPITENANSEVSQQPASEQQQPTINAEEEQTVDKAQIENQSQTPHIDDDTALKYLKSKGIEVDSFDDLKKTNQSEDPYKDILSDEDKAYFKFKQTTGGSREEFDQINKDWENASYVELAKAKALLEANLVLSDEEAAEIVAEELGVDLSDTSSLTAGEKFKLKKYFKEVIEAKKAERDRLFASIKEEENNPSQKQEEQTEETVTLQDGSILPKSEYEKRVAEYTKYVERNKEAVNSVTNFEFSITIDDKGKERTLNYNYEVSEEDKHSMLSMTNNTSEYINKMYLTDQGFDQKSFNEDMFWSNRNNRVKAIKALAQQIRAEAIEEVMKERGNVNLNPQHSLPTNNQKEGVVVKPISQILN